MLSWDCPFNDLFKDIPPDVSFSLYADDSAIWCTTPDYDIEDSSCVRVQDKDIFSRRVTGRPSDEGARSARDEPGKDILILHEEA